MSVRATSDLMRWQVPAFVGAIAACQVVTVAASPLAGAVCDAIVVLALLNLHAFAPRDADPPAVLPALALVPLIRVIGFAIPDAGISLVLRGGLVGALLLLALWLTNQVLPLRPPALKLRPRDLPEQALIAACGIPLGLIGQQILHPRPLAHAADPVAMVLAALVLGCLAAPSLELLFRWALHDQLFLHSPVAGPVLVNVLFASLYLGTRSAGYVVLMGLSGLGLSLSVRRSGIVTGAIVAHALFAIGLLIVWPAVLP
jgi:membrane protease YdiL (CAAX protease family)